MRLDPLSEAALEVASVPLVEEAEEEAVALAVPLIEEEEEDVAALAMAEED